MSVQGRYLYTQLWSGLENNEIVAVLILITEEQGDIISNSN